MLKKVSKKCSKSRAKNYLNDAEKYGKRAPKIGSNRIEKSFEMYRKSIGFFLSKIVRMGNRRKRKTSRQNMWKLDAKMVGRGAQNIYNFACTFFAVVLVGSIGGAQCCPYTALSLKISCVFTLFQFVFVRRKKRHIDQMNLGEARASAR